jgi:hypothetical protein
MASCPRKYHNNEDSHEVIEHHPLKSAYDIHQPTNYFVPSGNKIPSKLFKFEMNYREDIENYTSTQHSIDGSILGINPRDDRITKIITTMNLIIPRGNQAPLCLKFKSS